MLLFPTIYVRYNVDLHKLLIPEASSSNRSYGQSVGRW